MTKKIVWTFNLLLTGKLDVDNVELCLVSQFYVLRFLATSKALRENDSRLSCSARKGLARILFSKRPFLPDFTMHDKIDILVVIKAVRN